MANNDLLSTVFSWWPFVLLIAAWIAITRFSGPRTQSGAKAIELCEQQVAEARRMNASLERIAAALEKQP